MRISAMMAVILSVLLGVSAGAEGVYAIEQGAIAAMVDAQGRNILTDINATSVRGIGGQLYAVGVEENCALYDAQGNRFCEDTFETAWLSGGALIVKKDGRYGALDESGGWIVEPAWTQLVSTGEGGFLALSGNPLDEQPDEVSCVQPGMAPVHTGCVTTNGLRAFSNGVMPYRTENGLYGYLDAGGKPAMEALWQYAGDFEDGVAIVSDGDGFRLIDAGGEALTEALAWVKRGSGIIGAVSQDGTAVVLSADDGRQLYAVPGRATQMDVIGSAVAVTIGDSTTLFDAAGRALCTASGRATFRDGLDGQFIASDGDWGERCEWLVDPSGSAASARYQRILPLCGGRYAFMEMSGVEYQSSALDSVQISWDYGSIRYGLIDSAGRTVLPAMHLHIRPAGDDRLLLIDDHWVGFADLNGVVLRSWPLY